MSYRCNAIFKKKKKKKPTQVSFHTYKKNEHIKLVSFIKNWRKKESNIFYGITSFLTGSSFSDKVNSIWHGDDM